MAGRKQLDIKPKQVEKMASWGVPSSEIADYFNCSEATISVKFKDSVIKGKADLKMKLRRKQVTIALAGNVAMLIWLGKNLLNQTDKIQTADLSESEMEKLRQIASQEMKNNI